MAHNDSGIDIDMDHFLDKFTMLDATIFMVVVVVIVSIREKGHIWRKKDGKQKQKEKASNENPPRKD